MSMRPALPLIRFLIVGAALYCPALLMAEDSSAALPPDHSQSAALVITLPDFAATRTHFAASPLPKVWSSPTLTHERQDLDAIAPWVWGLVDEVASAQFLGQSTPTGDGLWQASFHLTGALPATVKPLLDQANVQPAGPDGASWSWSMAGDDLVARFGASNLTAARLAGADDLLVDADLLSLFRHGDEVPSVELFSALGFTRIRYGATIEATGIRDHLELIGLKAPLRPIARSDFAGIPSASYAVVALGLDGARLASLLSSLQDIPEMAALLDHYSRSTAATLGPVATLAKGLQGTAVAFFSPGLPTPNMGVSLPITPGLDALIEGLAALYKVPIAGCRSAAMALPPFGGSWPSNLWLRRDKRWVICNDAALAEQIATGTDNQQLPPLLEQAVGSQGAVYVAVQSLASVITQFSSLALSNAKDEAQQNTQRTHDIAAAFMRTPVPIDAVISCDEHGTSIRGHVALAAAALPACAVIIGIVAANWATDAEIKANVRAQFATAHAAASADHWGMKPPAQLHAVPAPSRRFTDRPWALYLPPADDARGDQPVAISDPHLLGKACLWLNRDGTISEDELQNCRELWETAKALAKRGTTCHAADWRKVLLAYQAEHYHDSELLRNEQANYAIYTPDKKWHVIDPKLVSASYNRVWHDPKSDMFFGIIAESFDAPRTSTWLHDVSLTRKRELDPKLTVLFDHEITLAGFTGQRTRVKVSTHGAPFCFDDSVLAHNGYLFQLIAWCGDQPGSEDDLTKAVDDLLQRFRLIDDLRFTDGFVQPEKPVKAPQTTP